MRGGGKKKAIVTAACKRASLAKAPRDRIISWPDEAAKWVARLARCLAAKDVAGTRTRHQEWAFCRDEWLRPETLAYKVSPFLYSSTSLEKANCPGFINRWDRSQCAV